MSKKYQLAVFIGRFSPLHHGHHKVINEALEIADKVLVLIGSSDSPRTLRNPFTYEERSKMITKTFKNVRIKTSPIKDYTYNDQAWVEAVQETIKREVGFMGWSDFPKDVCLIGHNKDSSSYYLKLFPAFDNVDVSLYDESDYTHDGAISATVVREHIFGFLPKSYENFVSKETAKVIESVGDGIIKLKTEYNWIQKHKKQWENSPYEPIFVTADAMVVQSGYVLVVERGHYPQIGKLALAGGYINPKENVVDCALRELKEETKIDVPLKVLNGNIVTTKVFDDPYRSERGRIITHCTLVQLPNNTHLPKVKGSDDAKDAFWIPLSDVEPEEFFEDHYHIIQNMKGYLK